MEYNAHGGVLMEYTQQDYDAIKSEVNKKLLLFGLIAAAAAAVTTVLFVQRIQWACYLFTFFAMSALAFFIFIYLVPPLRYRKFIKEMNAGQQRVNELRFICIEEGEDVRDGLPFRPFIAEDAEGYQHRYYWDVQKPLPEIKEGTMVRLTTYGQSIKKMEAL